MGLRNGFKWDRDNARLDFYYAGVRIGAIDAGGIDLASGLTFDVDGASVTASSLDAAYNGGASITVDAGAVTFTGSHGSNNTLAVTATGGTGNVVDIQQDGTGFDIEGTDDSWSISKAGAAILTTVAATVLTLSSDIDMSASATGTYDIILKDAVADALSIRRSGTDIIVFDTSTPRVTITPVTTITGALTATAGVTCTTGGLTVTAGGITVTGNSTFANNLTVTGSLSFGGNWTVAATLTVDELILDTDGAAPGGGNASVYSDNTGDTNINALTGKSINLQINESDEYSFSASTLTMNSNDVSGCGFLDMSATTIGHGDNVRIGHDNTGDLTLNAKNGKEVCISVNGTDTVQISATELEMKSASDIQFLGNDGILDSNANEVLLVEAVGSATTYLNIKNANNAAIELECFGAADKGFLFKNDQDEEILILTPIASADTEITILSAAASDPIIRSTGTADKGVIFQNTASEPTFQIDCTGTAAVNWLTVDASDTGVQVKLSNDGEVDIGFLFNAKDDEEILSLLAVTDAITYVEITSAATGVGGPTISSQGATNTNLILAPEGTGGVNINPGTAGTAASPALIMGGAAAGLDTGLWADTADEFGMTTGGTQCIYIGASQEVIIGTTKVTTFTGITGGALILDEKAAVGGTATNQAAIYAYDSGTVTTIAVRTSDGTSSDA